MRVRAAAPPGHIRTPHYTRGRCGVIDSHAGDFANPEELAYGRSGKPAIPLYRVRFEQRALWPDYEGGADDTLVVDIYEHWLELAPERDDAERASDGRRSREGAAPTARARPRRRRTRKRSR